VVDVIVKFADEARAQKFEKYLKSGSALSSPDGGKARNCPGLRSITL
jgi:hypothetical protein